MRQLLICNSFGTSKASLVGENKLTLHNSKEIVGFGSSVRDEHSLVLDRPNNEGGPIFVPVYAKDFSWSKKEYSQGTNRRVNLGPVTLPSSFDRDYHFAVILIVKGKQFNERNKYTVYHTVKKGTSSSSISWNGIVNILADKLSKLNLPISASFNSGSGTLLVESTDNSFDFTLLGTDDLLGCSVSNQNISVAQNTPEELQELISKAAADKGFNYTYKAASEYLYPALNGGTSKETRKYTLYTLRFAEPRMTKTRDEFVHQIVQVVAFGSGDETKGANDFESWLQGMSKPVTFGSNIISDGTNAGDSQLD